MDYEDLENRISKLETEIKSKLSWFDIMWFIIGALAVTYIGKFF